MWSSIVSHKWLKQQSSRLWTHHFLQLVYCGETLWTDVLWRNDCWRVSFDFCNYFPQFVYCREMLWTDVLWRSDWSRVVGFNFWKRRGVGAHELSGRGCLSSTLDWPCLYVLDAKRMDVGLVNIGFYCEVWLRRRMFDDFEWLQSSDFVLCYGVLSLMCTLYFLKLDCGTLLFVPRLCSIGNIIISEGL